MGPKLRGGETRQWMDNRMVATGEKTSGFSKTEQIASMPDEILK